MTDPKQPPDAEREQDAGHEATDSDAPASRRRRPYHERLVAVFVTHVKVEDVCTATGLSRSTVQRWKRDPENWAEVEFARGEVLRDALATLRNGLPRAAARLVKVATECQQESIAVRAALGCFDALKGLTEATEFDERLAKLEEANAARSAAAPATRPFPKPTLLTGNTSRG